MISRASVVALGVFYDRTIIVLLLFLFFEHTKTTIVFQKFTKIFIKFTTLFFTRELFCIRSVGVGTRRGPGPAQSQSHSSGEVTIIVAAHMGYRGVRGGDETIVALPLQSF